MDDISRDFPADAGGERSPRSRRDREGRGRGPSGAGDLPAEQDDAGEDLAGDELAGGDAGDWDPAERAGLLLDRMDTMSDDDADPEALDPDAGGRDAGGRDAGGRGGRVRARRGSPDGEGPEGNADGSSGDADGVSAADAAAALAAAEESLEVDPDDDGTLGEDGLPPVPELQDPEAVARVVFVLLLSQKDGLSLLRLAQACNTTQKVVEQALEPLQKQLDELGLPVDLARTGDAIKFLSRPEAFPFLQRLRGVKKLEKLSPAALETLAVVAYRQPVMRAEIEAIRGVKAGPMLRTLLSHKLVRVTGRADVPGRPLQYGTTQHFLERFGLSSLNELPSVKEWKQLG